MNLIVLLKLKIILIQFIIKVNGIGCPYWKIVTKQNSYNVQEMILLKSNPQKFQEDIAAVVFYPFVVGIFNFEENQQYEIIESNDSAQLYQIDKDDRASLKVSIINTLDSRGRIITWSAENGAQVQIIQIPTDIIINKQSCLNSQERLVITWDNSILSLIDYSDISLSIKSINLTQNTSFLNCTNDQLNRRFLLTNDLGQVFSYDIENKSIYLLFELKQFQNLQSLYPTSNQVAVAFQTQNGNNCICSFRSQNIQFQQCITKQISTVLTSLSEDQIIIVGFQNLFEIWDIKQNQLNYRADFQNINCDQRDANTTAIAQQIDFMFASISKNNEIVSISNNYIFAYSIQLQKTIVFKNQNLGFYWLQAFIIQDNIILSSDLSVSNINKLTQKFVYATSYFGGGSTSYDYFSQIEIDLDLNRIIMINASGILYYWSLIDSLEENFSIQQLYAKSFFIDKQINKLIQYPSTIVSQFNKIYIYQYREGNLLDTISLPFSDSNQTFKLLQDQVNCYLIGFITETSQYVIYKLTSDNDHSLIFLGQLINNSIIGDIVLIQSSKQILVNIQYCLYLFNYIYDNSLINSQNIPIKTFSGIANTFFFNYLSQNLLIVSDNSIQICQFNGVQFSIQSEFSYNTGNNNGIYQLELFGIIILNRSNKMYIKNYNNLVENIVNFQNNSILKLDIDYEKGFLVLILNNYQINVVNIQSGQIQYNLQIEQKLVYSVQIQSDKNTFFIIYQNGDIISYDYIQNLFLGIIYSEYSQNVIQFNPQYNQLVQSSYRKVYTRSMDNKFLISQINTQNAIISYYIDQQSGLTFILTNEVIIFNHVQQNYLPPFPKSVDLSNAYIIFAIPSLNYLLVGFSTKQFNQIFVYNLKTYEYITLLNHNVTQCNNVLNFYLDNYSNRLFSACLHPGTIIAWDITKNFQLIKVLNSILSTLLISQIVFNPQLNLIMILGYSWWSKCLDYQTLQFKCEIEGIYGNFDYSHNLLFAWDQNGDFRIFDQFCNIFFYQPAHSSWINQALIDEQNMLLTTVSEDLFIKTWSYQNIIQVQKMNQIQLANPLSYAFLDYDNKYILASDYNGFIYFVSYPDLVLQRTIQVTSQYIDYIYLDTFHNMIIYGSQEANSIGYYNLMEYLKASAYSKSFADIGILTTLNVENGIIFYEGQNIVQFWNSKTNQLIYGFYVNSKHPYNEAQAQFQILEGQNNIASLITMYQTLFFNINTLSIINVKNITCQRNTQLISYFICSYLNQINIIYLYDYSLYQVIQLQPNSIIIQLQQINKNDSFFITTTQGEVFCYQLNINQTNPQFIQKFNIKVFEEAISNYYFTQQSNSTFLIILSTLNGGLVKIELSQELSIINQQIISQSKYRSHAHIIKLFKNNVFIKRTLEYSLNIYDIQNFNLIQSLDSPCLGYIYKLEISEELDYILQHCLGVYQLNYLSNFTFIGLGRYTKNISIDIYTQDQNQIIFINKQYFIDLYQYEIYIYKIDFINQLIIQLSDFQILGYFLGNVANYNIYDTPENTFINLILYSSDYLSQLQLPIQGQDTCVESFPISQLAQVLSSIQCTFAQIQNYCIINSLIFQVIVSQETVMLSLPSFQFSNNTIINIQSNDIQNYQNIIVDDRFFSSFSGYRQIKLQNLQIKPMSEQNSILYYKIQNITSLVLQDIYLNSQIIYTFQISQINSVLFQGLYIINQSYISSNYIQIFNFTAINQMVFNQINIQQSNFQQTCLFYFQDNINNPLTSILIQDSIIHKSQFQFIDDQSDTAPIYISNYQSVKFLNLSFDQNNGSPVPLIKSYIVSQFQILQINFINNNDIMLLLYNNYINHINQTISNTQKLLKDNTVISKLFIINNTFTQYKSHSVVEINNDNLFIQDSQFISNKAILTQTVQLLQFQSISQQTISNNILQMNEGFLNLLLIQESTSTIQNITISDNKIAQAVKVLNSFVYLFNSKIKNNLSKSQNEQMSIITILDNSNLTIQDSSFEQNQSNQGGSLYIIQSNLQILNTQFNNDTSGDSGGSIFASQSILVIDQCTFNLCNSQNGGCIYINQGNLFLNATKSQNTTANLNGGFLYANQVLLLRVNNTNMLNCKANNNGGSIYLLNSGGFDSYIGNSNFENNIALGSGGSILLDNSQLQLLNSNFTANQAGVGGAIRYLNLKPIFLVKQTNLIKDSCKTYQNNQCKSNVGIVFGNHITSYPQYASILPSRDFDVDIRLYPEISFNNFRSGLSNFDFTIQFLDELKTDVKQIDFQNRDVASQLSQELISEISNYNCKVYQYENAISLQNQTIKIEGATSVDYKYYSQNKIGCVMNSFKVTGIPSKNATLILQLNGMKTLNNSNQFIDVNNIKININFRNCRIGEFYSSSCQNCSLKECVQCMNGTYSLVNPSVDSNIQCKNCDLQKAQSCQLDQIILKQNYWRKNKYSDIIYQCDADSQVCNGDESKGYCAQGYIGALCQACDNYGRVWGESYGQVNSINKKSIECMKCTQLQKNSLKQALILIAVLIYFFFLMLEAYNNNCKISQIRALMSLGILNMGISSFLLQSQIITKIFINQFLIIATIKQSMGITFPDLFFSFITFSEFTSQPVLMFVYSLDCSLSLLNQDIPIQYLRFIYISIVLPFILCLLIYLLSQIFIYMIKVIRPSFSYYYQVVYDNSNIIVSSLLIFIYLVSQNIYQAGLQIIFCLEFDGTYYMKSQMDYQCYTQQHYFYIFSLVLPVLLIIVVVYPIFMLYVLYINKSKLLDKFSSKIVRKYGYFFSGYKKNRWWWELVITQYKFITLIIATYLSSQAIQQLLSITFIQSIYCALQIYFKPYEDNKMNKLELKSCINTLMIFWVSIFKLYNFDNSFLNVISSILLVLGLSLLFGSLIFSFIEVLIRRNFYLFNKNRILKCFINLMKYIIKGKGKNERQNIKIYLKRNFWSLYNLIYIDDYNTFRVFNNWKKVKKLLQYKRLSTLQLYSITEEQSKKSFKLKTFRFNSNNNKSNIKSLSKHNLSSDLRSFSRLLSNYSPQQKQLNLFNQSYQQQKLPK
ncbi:transmembrane protein, putative (macronuclear) [Tetrahymena thermophila SB210]|uniref:Transmembrane protein, putative n=1 Tax=Tetrahymena thermophila (strain SB210) TaxID=312017 RepID=W7XDS2_TETTS|nr:transmembrane protein, putative [Tetrahymena thermophila SB210]EWS72016.1 transmembrane protein, putative [Tetrahymena thermophila SB210]|eukprot:XP_012655446.1 transmembrane protein, putative [Tetrahymena thermophila SB210]